MCMTLSAVIRDYEAKSALDSYESAGLDNEVTEGGYEEQLAAARMAEEAMEERDAAGRRGRKRMPGALEGKTADAGAWLAVVMSCSPLTSRLVITRLTLQDAAAA